MPLTMWSKMTQKPAAFLDRDGTIIKDKHYLHKPDEIEFLPDALKALKLLTENNYLIFIVTNQSGVGRGMFEMSDVFKVHQELINLLKNEAITINDIKVCPHSPEDNCECRKPKPTMIQELISTHQNIDIKNSFMCGDKDSDVQSGLNAGIKGYLVKEKNLLDIVQEHLALS